MKTAKALFVALAATVLTAGVANAATITVNTTADDVADDGFCSLREAVTAANNDAASGVSVGECAAGSGADVIDVPANTYVLTGGVLALSSDVDLQGAGAGSTIIDGNSASALLSVGAGATVTASAITLQGGSANVGGAIAVSGSLELVSCAVNDNQATSDAGAIDNAGTLIATGTTFARNAAGGSGGAIVSSGTATLTNCTLSNNVAGVNGGALQVTGGTTTLAFSTITANLAAGVGGGVESTGTLAAQGTIIADNTDGGTAPDVSGDLGSTGYNLVSDVTGTTGTVGTDIIGAADLDVLADNGGTTTTHAPLLGSAALGAVPPLSCTVSDDQTGTARPVGTNCDIGAFEGRCETNASCDDSNDCTTDTCSPATGCSTSNVADTTACEDGDLCTVGETCTAGVCGGGSPKDCTAFDDACNTGTCDLADGSCFGTPTNEGGACDDGDACTQTDTCASGTCTGGNPVDCTGLDTDCTTGVCNSGDGSCSAQNVNEGGACSDGNDCTTGTTCTTGTCGGGTDVAEGTSCDDGDPTTTQDACDASGACVYACGNGVLDPGETCDDDNSATGDGCDDTCTPETGWNCDGGEPTVCTLIPEDCADGVDDNGAAGIDCADPTCSADPYCDPCTTGRSWTFDVGPGQWVSDKDITASSLDMWLYSSGEWRTAGTQDIDNYLGGGTHRGHLNLTIDLPPVEQLGPEPVLTVTYRHSGDNSNGKDVFGICINDPTCEFGDASVAFARDTPTGSFVEANVDLSAYIGQTVTLTMLYDTVDNKNNGNDGVRITSIEIASDTDADNLIESDDPVLCDPCWDADADGYGHPASPGTCPQVGGDCNDFEVGINPGATEVCDTPEDDDCDGFVNGFDADCGVEDCANGLDDNSDNNVDCDDPVCSGDPYCATCSVGFDFDSGPGGWQAADSPSGVFEHGVSSVYASDGNDQGWETVLDGNVSTVGGASTVVARIWRDIAVPVEMPAPAIRVSYNLSGELGPNKDIFGVCVLNTSSNATLCDANSAFTDFATSTDTPGTGFDEAVVELPAGSAGSTVRVVLFYDTIDGANNDNAGVYVESVTLGSDADGDGLYEFTDNACDRCLDADGDGYPDNDNPVASHPAIDPSTCTGCGVGKDCTLNDCDDTDPQTKPEQFEICSSPEDNNCDGLQPIEDPSCSVCGDNVVGAGEQCDDGNDQPGDGCSATCEIEPGSLYVTEIHLNTPGGNPGEQWIEIYNSSPSPVDLVELDLRLTNQVGDQQVFASDCTILSSNLVQPSQFYVIGLGSAGASDGVNPDATCQSAFTLSAGGDRIRLRAGTVDLDTVDFSSFSCELDKDLYTGIARSLMLQNPSGSSSSGNDVEGVWCLADDSLDYSNSGNHRGSPGTAGNCGEFACDGDDDDCNGLVDDGLPDSDVDGICNERDCLPNDNACAVTTDDATCDDIDVDSVKDCIDTCIDFDKDGYGVGSGCIAADCYDGAGGEVALPGGEETENPSDPLFADSCFDGLDNDCDGAIDCADIDGCGTASVCSGEICENPVAIGCGEVVELSAGTGEMPCAPGADSVLSFTATFDGNATVELENYQSRRYSMTVLPGTCVTGSCSGAITSSQPNCGATGSKTFAVTNGSTYSLVMDEIDTCSAGPSGFMGRVTVRCDEQCEPCPGGDCSAGFDDDLDGFIDCEDSDCATSSACSDYDTDGDGVSNANEILCGDSPSNPLVFPSVDDLNDVEKPTPDGVINCVDTDDDNDGASDADELAQCSLNVVFVAKNNADITPGGDKNCLQANIDADCNGKFDTQEPECGFTETNCADGLDNDQDGFTDCADSNCVLDSFCYYEDYDGDGVPNGFEADCAPASYALDPTLTPGPLVAGDPDNDGFPNCKDTDDDDDGYLDTTELACGSDQYEPSSTPPDFPDGDGVCNAQDDDDDDDGFTDEYENNCGSNPQNASSVPIDTDGDGLCNAQDLDDDNDGWSDTNEESCLTDQLDPLDNPTDNGEDLDDDKLCDINDDDDDGDGWFDTEEPKCKTDPHDPASVPIDTDGDGTCDIQETDADGDGWFDGEEEACGSDPLDAQSVPLDTDGDLDCDALDADDDNDGVIDGKEITCGTDPLSELDAPTDDDLLDIDQDKILNCADDDDDNDGLSDTSEVLHGSDKNKPDTDLDGLKDGEEDVDDDGVVDQGETSPVKADTDSDGLNDGYEADGNNCYPTGIPGECLPTSPTNADTDGDGLNDGDEVGQYKTSPTDADSDDDNYNDGEEILCKSDPLDPEDQPTDYNNDGTCDGAQQDDDGDGIANVVEIQCKTDPKDFLEFPKPDDLVDLDGDGLLNCEDPDDDDDGVEDEPEIECGYDPRSDTSTPTVEEIGDYDQDGSLNCADPDDDNDGIADVDEATYGTDSKDADSDDDGLLDGEEIDPAIDTDPTNPDTDGDGVQDGTEIGKRQGHPRDTDVNVFQPDLDPTSKTDPNDADSDDDRISDGEEDANANGRVDEGESDPTFKEDADEDGLGDVYETRVTMTDPNNPDTDGDGLSDGIEHNNKKWAPVGCADPCPASELVTSDPLLADTDGGGVNDGDEVANGTNPVDPSDDFDGAQLSGDNVFSCSGGGSSAPLWVLSLLVLGFIVLRRRGRGWLLALAFVVGAGAVAVSPGSARAQTAAAVGNFNAEQFSPAGGLYRIFAVEGSQVGPQWRPYASLLFHGERESLKLKVGRHEETLISAAQWVDLNVGVGLFNRLQVEIGLPIALGMETGEAVASINKVDGPGIGDMLFRVRGTILENLSGGFGLGATLGLTFPTGDSDRFRGDPLVGVIINLIADYRWEQVVLALNLGTKIRTEDAVFLDNEISHELMWGMGVEVILWKDGVNVGFELFGKTPLTDPFASLESTSLEFLLGPKWWIIPGLNVQAAVGGGLVQGYGTPDFRWMIGVQYAPSSKDSDGDGIPDTEDGCPYKAEDPDGFADTDGCPERDNDNDGIPDEDDECPNDPEDFNNNLDEDGCPDKPKVLDQDSDGIPDAVDQCPSLRETFNGYQDSDGCPDKAPETKGPEPEPKKDDVCDFRITAKVFFPKNNAKLDGQAKATIARVQQQIVGNPLITKVEVNGHASDEGPEVENLSLSKKRADRVRKYMIKELQMSSDLLVPRGFGESAPIETGSDPEARKANRRVDFTVVLGGKCEGKKNMP